MLVCNTVREACGFGNRGGHRVGQEHRVQNQKGRLQSQLCHLPLCDLRLVIRDLSTCLLTAKMEMGY